MRLASIVAALAALLSSCLSAGGVPPALSLETVEVRLGAFERAAETYRAYYAAEVPPANLPRNATRAGTFLRVRDDIALARAAVQAAIADGTDPEDALIVLLRTLPPLLAARDPDMLPIAAGLQLLLELFLPVRAEPPPPEPSASRGTPTDQRRSRRPSLASPPARWAVG